MARNVTIFKCIFIQYVYNVMYFSLPVLQFHNVTVIIVNCSQLQEKGVGCHQLATVVTSRAVTCKWRGRYIVYASSLLWKHGMQSVERRSFENGRV